MGVPLYVFLPNPEESKLGRILVETVILLSMHDPADAAKMLCDVVQPASIGKADLSGEMVA